MSELKKKMLCGQFGRILLKRLDVELKYELMEVFFKSWCFDTGKVLKYPVNNCRDGQQTGK